MPANKTRTALNEYIFLHSTRREDPLTFIYEIECTVLYNIAFTINFEGSENFLIIPSGPKRTASKEMKLTTTATPFVRQEIGSVTILDMDKRASLRYSCAWKLSDINEQEIRSMVDRSNKLLVAQIREAEKLHFPKLKDDPMLKKVAELTGQSHQTFLDPDFPPVLTSIIPQHMCTGKAKKHELEGVAPLLEWRRAGAKTGEDWSGGLIRAQDVRPGLLSGPGVSALLSALAALAEHAPQSIVSLLDKWCPEAGAYVIRLFCASGETRVRIDDLLPHLPASPGPVFSTPDWVALVEKAYAKHCGGAYAFLAQPRHHPLHQVLVDLTGKPVYQYNLPTSLLTGKDLWHTMVYHQQCGDLSVLTVSPGLSPGASSIGLVPGQGYVVLGVKTLTTGHQLLHIR